MNTKPILYYSNFCKFSQGILQSLSQSECKNEIHYINIDNRFKENNQVIIRLENNTCIPLPNIIKHVPSLLLLNKGNKVLVGNDIKTFIFEKVNSTKVYNPTCYEFSKSNNVFIKSDVYSYLDQSSDELSAKGSGGLRQMYNYASYDSIDSIDTPPDNFESNKVKDVTIENIIEKRRSELKSIQPNNLVR